MSISLASLHNKIDKNEILFTVFDACRCGYYEFVKSVFDEYPSDINITNELNQTCLMICCEFNEVEIAKYLLSKKRINYLSYDNENHWNSLHVALRYSNFRIAQLLLNKPSNITFPKYTNDYNGYNPFDLLPPNLHKKQLYDDIYTLKNKQTQRQIFNASYTNILVRIQWKIHLISRVNTTIHSKRGVVHENMALEIRKLYLI